MRLQSQKYLIIKLRGNTCPGAAKTRTLVARMNSAADVRL